MNFFIPAQYISMILKSKKWWHAFPLHQLYAWHIETFVTCRGKAANATVIQISCDRGKLSSEKGHHIWLSGHPVFGPFGLLSNSTLFTTENTEKIAFLSQQTKNATRLKKGTIKSYEIFTITSCHRWAPCRHSKSLISICTASGSSSAKAPIDKKIEGRVEDGQQLVNTYENVDPLETE